MIRPEYGTLLSGYLNITDEELRKALTGVWERRRQLKAVGDSQGPAEGGHFISHTTRQIVRHLSVGDYPRSRGISN